MCHISFTSFAFHERPSHPTAISTLFVLAFSGILLHQFLNEDPWVLSTIDIRRRQVYNM